VSGAALTVAEHNVRRLDLLEAGLLVEGALEGLQPLVEGAPARVPDVRQRAAGRGAKAEWVFAFVIIKVTLLINHYNKNKLANYF